MPDTTSVCIADLLCVVVRATLAAQRYVIFDLLRLSKAMPHMRSVQPLPQSPSLSSSTAAQTILDLSTHDREALVNTLHHTVGMEVKSHLSHKEGSAAKDMVTSADVVTQAVLLYALQAAFPTQPYTIVGEEEAPSPEMEEQVQACLRHHYRPAEAIPFERELRAQLKSQGSDASADHRAHAASVVQSPTVEALRDRIGIFIDPIDGTNCFIDGVWEAPMTLTGITVDGIPVAGVMNRVFLYPLPPSAGTSEDFTTNTPCRSGLSYILHYPSSAAPFIVFDGQLISSTAAYDASTSPARQTPTTDLIVCHSSTTKESFLRAVTAQLEPCQRIRARGAGYKLYLLLRQALAREACSTADTALPSDVFVCPRDAIKKWDCCGPHAFLLALQGDMWTVSGEPLRYSVRAAAAQSTAGTLAGLPGGVVAATAGAKGEVIRRLQWSVGPWSAI